MSSSSRASSFSSVNSDASTSTSTSSTSQHLLADLATTLIDLLYNKRDFTSASSLIHPNTTSQHQDDLPLTSRDEFLNSVQSRLRLHSPNTLNVEIKEAVVDEDQRKVWVQSEFNVDGRRKLSVDMMTFDKEGLLVGTSGWRRVIREDIVDEEVVEVEQAEED